MIAGRYRRGRTQREPNQSAHIKLLVPLHQLMIRRFHVIIDSANPPIIRYRAIHSGHAHGALLRRTHRRNHLLHPAIQSTNAVGESLKPRIAYVAHPGSRGAGLPDGGLYPAQNRHPTAPLPNQRPERGALEIKPPGENIATLAQSEQVLRYLTNTASASSPTTTSFSSSSFATANPP